MDPNLTDIQHARAVALFQIGQFKDSLEAVQKYLNIHPENEKAKSLENRIQKEKSNQDYK